MNEKYSVLLRPRTHALPPTPDLSTYLRPLLILRKDRGDLCVRTRRIMGYVTVDLACKRIFPSPGSRRRIFVREFGHGESIEERIPTLIVAAAEHSFNVKMCAFKIY